MSSVLPLFSANAEYTSNGIILDLFLLPFTDFFKHGNTGAIADCLDDLPESAGSDFAFVVDQLRFLPTLSDVERALLQMQPSIFTDLALDQEYSTLDVSNAVLNRLDAVSRVCSPASNKEWRVWASALLGYNHQGHKHQEPSYAATTPGVVVGFDRTHWNRDAYWGGILGYTYSHLHWGEKRGHANIQAIYTAVYGKWARSLGYLEGVLMGGYDFYQASRHIQIDSSVNRRANSSHDGQEASAHVKGALTFETHHTAILPFIQLDYLYLHENSFHERGAQSLDLSVKDKNSDLLSTELGIDFSHCLKEGDMTFTPFLQLGVLRESRFMGRKEKATLEGACEFTVKGLNPSRTLGAAGAGLNATFNFPLSQLNLVYQGKYGSAFQDHTVYLQLLGEF